MELPGKVQIDSPVDLAPMKDLRPRVCRAHSWGRADGQPKPEMGPELGRMIISQSPAGIREAGRRRRPSRLQDSSGYGGGGMVKEGVNDPGPREGVAEKMIPRCGGRPARF